jgi:hypothetical protein
MFCVQLKSIPRVGRRHQRVLALQAEKHFYKLFISFGMCTTYISGSVEHPMTVPTKSAT